MESSIVYRIVNLVNEKCYVGITRKTFKQRYPGRDWWTSSSINRCLKDAVKKYGPANFKVEILEHSIDLDKLEEREIYWIEFFKSTAPNGYNLTSGGNYKTKVSEESKLKNSISNRGRVPYNKGKKTRPESIKKRIQKMIGKPAWNKGLKMGRPSEQAVINSAKAHCKSVLCFSLEGVLVKEYKSVTETKVDGFSPCQVSLCCNGKARTHRNMTFKFNVIY